MGYSEEEVKSLRIIDLKVGGLDDQTWPSKIHDDPWRSTLKQNGELTIGIQEPLVVLYTYKYIYI